jgi:hypothetical protein
MSQMLVRQHPMQITVVLVGDWPPTSRMKWLLTGMLLTGLLLQVRSLHHI